MRVLLDERLSVVVLRASSSRVVDLRRLVPELLTALPVAKQGEVTWVGIDQA